MSILVVGFCENTKSEDLANIKERIIGMANSKEIGRIVLAIDSKNFSDSVYDFVEAITESSLGSITSVAIQKDTVRSNILDAVRNASEIVVRENTAIKPTSNSHRASFENIDVGVRKILSEKSNIKNSLSVNEITDKEKPLIEPGSIKTIIKEEPINHILDKYSGGKEIELCGSASRMSYRSILKNRKTSNENRKTFEFSDIDGTSGLN